MKIHILLAFAGLAIASGFSLPVFAQEKNQVDPKIEQQIRVLAANYDAAINKHDPAAVAAFYAQNASKSDCAKRRNVLRSPSHEKAYAKYDSQGWQVSLIRKMR